MVYWVKGICHADRKACRLSEEQEKTRHAKHEWGHTFDAVSDLITIVDNNHTIVRVNRAMAERCGRTPKELVGRKCFEVMHGTNNAPADCLHVKLIESQKPQTAEFELENSHGIFEVTMSPSLMPRGR